MLVFAVSFILSVSSIECGVEAIRWQDEPTMASMGLNRETIRPGGTKSSLGQTHTNSEKEQAVRDSEIGIATLEVVRQEQYPESSEMSEQHLEKRAHPQTLGGLIMAKMTGAPSPPIPQQQNSIGRVKSGNKSRLTRRTSTIKSQSAEISKYKTNVNKVEILIDGSQYKTLPMLKFEPLEGVGARSLLIRDLKNSNSVSFDPDSSEPLEDESARSLVSRDLKKHNSVSFDPVSSARNRGDTNTYDSFSDRANPAKPQLSKSPHLSPGGKSKLLKRLSFSKTGTPQSRKEQTGGQTTNKSFDRKHSKSFSQKASPLTGWVRKFSWGKTTSTKTTFSSIPQKRIPTIPYLDPDSKVLSTTLDSKIGFIDADEGANYRIPKKLTPVRMSKFIQGDPDPLLNPADFVKQYSTDEMNDNDIDDLYSKLRKNSLRFRSPGRNSDGVLSEGEGGDRTLGTSSSLQKSRSSGDRTRKTSSSLPKSRSSGYNSDRSQNDEEDETITGYIKATANRFEAERALSSPARPQSPKSPKSSASSSPQRTRKRAAIVFTNYKPPPPKKDTTKKAADLPEAGLTDDDFNHQFGILRQSTLKEDDSGYTSN